MDRSEVDGWLRHLRRDARGRPVPFVNQWGVEHPDRVSVGWDPLVNASAMFLADDPTGEPNFHRMNVGRQRRSIVLGLCQVCTRPVPWSRRNLVVSTVSTNVVSVADFGDAVAVSESWLDDRCAEVAMTWCPELIRRSRGEDLTLLRVRSKRDARFIVSRGRVDGWEAAGDRVVLWVKVALHQRLISGG